jgi:hypothetical protein
MPRTPRDRQRRPACGAGAKSGTANSLKRGLSWATTFKGLSSKPAFVIDADATGVALGAMFLSTVGDVNGDGVPGSGYRRHFRRQSRGGTQADLRTAARRGRTVFPRRHTSGNRRRGADRRRLSLLSGGCPEVSRTLDRNERPRRPTKSAVPQGGTAPRNSDIADCVAGREDR